MEVHAVEGNTQMLDGGAMFGNAPKTMWEKWVEVDHLNRIPMACRSLLIKNKNGKKYLFEAGIGSFFEPKLKERYGVVESEHVLINNLRKLNVSHEQIDFVILSHLHFDHAGGLLSSYSDGPLKLLFPNAKYYVGEEQWLRAKTPHPRDKTSFLPLLNDLLEKSDRLVLVKNTGDSDLSPFVTFRFSNGHTPGLMLSEIHLPDGPLLFSSDLIPGAAWMHVPISMGYDRYPELVIDEKRKLLEELYPKNAKIFFTHDAKYSMGLIKRDANAKYYAEEVRI